MWFVVAALLGVFVLAHTAPFRFALDAGRQPPSMWRVARSPGAAPTIYLTFDDGPNPAATPALLDVLAREQVHATFFVIDEHVSAETVPIVRRMFADGHAVAQHSGKRWLLLKSPSDLAAMLITAADRIERLAGQRPCRAFRPHGGWRSMSMYRGLQQVDYNLIGWGWMLWDVDPLRRRVADRVADRLVSRASAGDILVMHDGDEKAPRKPQPQTVEATERLIPALRDRGLSFGTVCR